MIALPATIIHPYGRIELSKIIGQGGFSIVYSGHINNYIMAVKVAPRLDDEIRIMNTFLTRENLLSHFNNAIPTLPEILLHGYCGIRDVHYFAIPRYTMNLREFRNQRNFSNSAMNLLDVHNATKNVLSALNYLARYKIVHLDIKSSNIMLRNENDTSNCVLIDFGLAQLEDSNLNNNNLLNNNAIKNTRARLTPMYSPISIYENSPKRLTDDLESLYYNICDWFGINLPWKNKHNEIEETQSLKKTFFATFCIESNLQFEIRKYLELFYNSSKNCYNSDAIPYEFIYQQLDLIAQNYVDKTQEIESIRNNNQVGNNTEYYTIHQTQLLNLNTEVNNTFLSNKIVLKDSLSNQKINAILQNTRNVGVVLHFERMQIRGFYYSFYTNIDINNAIEKFGNKSYENKYVAHNRLNYNVNPIFSLLRGIISLTKHMGKENIRNVMILVVENTFVKILKEILYNNTISEKDFGQYFINAIKEFKENVNSHVDKMTIVYVNLRSNNEIITDTINHYDEIINIHINETKSPAHTNIRKMVYRFNE